MTSKSTLTGRGKIVEELAQELTRRSPNEGRVTTLMGQLGLPQERDQALRMAMVLELMGPVPPRTRRRRDHEGSL